MYEQSFFYDGISLDGFIAPLIVENDLIFIRFLRWSRNILSKN